MQRFAVSFIALLICALVAACSGGATDGNGPSPGAPTANPGHSAAPIASASPGIVASPTPAATSSPTPANAPSASPTPQVTSTATVAPMDSRFVLPGGFYGNKIASVSGARQIAVLPNGDLLVGTTGSTIDIVPNAEASGAAGTAHQFIGLPEGPAESVVYAPNGYVYAATNTTIWQIAYTPGATTASNPVAIARVRQGSVAPNSDGDVHTSTTIAISGSRLYAGVGSSCNACVEVDPTRATVQQMNLDGSGMSTLATRSRNPIALAINPATGSLWIGGAGQDNLPYTHPYEYFDSPTLRGTANIDYGWPQCEENQHAYNALNASPAPNCGGTVAPKIEFPAYATLIGAAFYPLNQTGAHAFPSAYRGGVFVTSHGSWHCCPATPPRVFFVAMNGDAPATAVNWSDPTTQSSNFLSGLGSTASNSAYLARPTGIAVGAQGSVFIADDANGAIYRIRPAGT